MRRPLYDFEGAASGFSSSGVNLEGRPSDIKTLIEWHHAATGRLPWFEREYKKLLDQYNKLKEDKLNAPSFPASDL